MDNIYISKHLQYSSVLEELKYIKINYATVYVPGGDSAYERGGDARRKFWIKPLKETDLGMAQAFLTPKRDHHMLKA